MILHNQISSTFQIGLQKTIHTATKTGQYIIVHDKHIQKL